MLEISQKEKISENMNEALDEISNIMNNTARIIVKLNLSDILSHLMTFNGTSNKKSIYLISDVVNNTQLV